MLHSVDILSSLIPVIYRRVKMLWTSTPTPVYTSTVPKLQAKRCANLFKVKTGSQTKVRDIASQVATGRCDLYANH